MKEELINYITDRNTSFWYIPNKGNGINYWHRLDGPAIEYADGRKEWWIDGKLHRLDGPAVEEASGTKYWYVNGNQIFPVEWLKENDVDLSTKEGQVAFKLRWL